MHVSPHTYISIKYNTHTHTHTFVLQVAVPKGMHTHTHSHTFSLQVAVPEGVQPGGQFKVKLKVPKKMAANNASVISEETTVHFDQAEVSRRVENLRTPFMRQADALFRKNLSFQRKRKCTNCCLICIPVVFLILVLLLQLLIEILFLGKNLVRCPYCGPSDDDFGKLYCNKQDCVEYFFPGACMYIEIYTRMYVYVYTYVHIHICAYRQEPCVLLLLRTL